MTKVLFTAVVADMRGKLAGTVFSRNRGGAVARTKVTPVNRRTPAQQLARADFGNFSSAWRALTAAQRQGWNAAGPNFPRTDQFGNQKILSGQQLFVSLNSNLQKVAAPPINDAPVAQGATYEHATGLSVQVTTGALELIYTSQVQPGTANSFYVRATPALSTGVDNPTGRFKAIGTLPIPAGGTAGTKLLSPQWQNVFGAMPASGKIFVEITAVNTITGEVSAPLILATDI